MQNDSILNELFEKQDITINDFKNIIKKVKSKNEGLDNNTYEYLQKIKLLIENDKFTEFAGEVNLLFGKYWLINNEFKISNQYINESIEFYKSKSDNFNIVYSILAKAEAFRAENRLQEALTTIAEAEQNIKGYDRYLIAKSENRRAAVLYQLQQTVSSDSSLTFKNQALETAFKSLKFSNEIRDFDLIINNYNIIGSIYRDFQKFDSAIVFFKKAIDIFKINPDSSFTLYQTHLVYHNLAKTYLLLNNFDEIISICNALLDFSNITDVNYSNVNTYSFLAFAYEKKGNYQIANDFLKKKHIEYVKFATKNKSKVDFENEEKYKSMQIEKEKTENKFKVYIQFIISTLLVVFSLLISIIQYKKNKNQKQNLITIQNQNDQLQELNATKDKFFSIIAHDIKNPLLSMINSAYFLSNTIDELDKEEIQEISNTLHHSSDHLYQLLDNLLTWSRSQRGLINVSNDLINVNLLFKNNIDLCKPMAKDKNIALKTELDSDFIIHSDLNILSTILRNLTTNAIKFTPNGGIIKFQVENAIRDNKKQIVFSVSDNGIGMSKDKIDRLFIVGNNKSSLGTNFEKGTGLGLILCKEFLNKLGGNIWVKSTSGKGSTFYFSIPQSD